MQNSNQFNNIFRQAQNGHIRRSSPEEEEEGFFIPEPPSDSSPPEVWEEYVSDLQILLFKHMLNSVEVYSKDEFQRSLKRSASNPRCDINDVLWTEANHTDPGHDCYIVSERPWLRDVLNEGLGKNLVNNIYVAHQYLTRAYEDEAYALEEGGPIE